MEMITPQTPYTTLRLDSCGICDGVEKHKLTYSRMLHVEFRSLLDAEMKRLQSERKGAKKSKPK